MSMVKLLEFAAKVCTFDVCCGILPRCYWAVGSNLLGGLVQILVFFFLPHRPGMAPGVIMAIAGILLLVGVIKEKPALLQAWLGVTIFNLGVTLVFLYFMSYALFQAQLPEVTAATTAAAGNGTAPVDDAAATIANHCAAGISIFVICIIVQLACIPVVVLHHLRLQGKGPSSETGASSVATSAAAAKPQAKK